MDSTTRKFIKKVTIDNISLALVMIPVLILYLNGEPIRRGFFCDDLTIRLPYLKTNSVPGWLLGAYGLSLPIFGFVIVEFLHNYFSKASESIRIFESKKLLPWIWFCYLRIEEFLFGAACTLFLTFTAKLTIGRLRPYFYDACQPNVFCDNPGMKYHYVENYYCTRLRDVQEMSDMRMAFLSGHASFSTYAMLYLAIYLHVRVSWQDGKMLKHVSQFLCVLIAFYTSLSRISDFKHHWGDVLAGGILGAIVAIVTVVYISKLFTQSNLYLTEEEVDENDSVDYDTGVDSMSEAKSEPPPKVVSEQTAI